jgi:transposase-like protein
MVQVNIKRLIDDVQCYQTVRELRWPDGITCPSCQSTQVIKRGFDDTEPARQRYACHDCDTRFDDLTDTIFAGRHQPLKVWVVCLYFMGLNISNEQIAQELAHSIAFRGKALSSSLLACDLNVLPPSYPIS